ncbi:MAG: SMP-30/gluconolactonase/LRE family protein [Gemmatimonadaceae bacterium]
MAPFSRRLAVAFASALLALGLLYFAAWPVPVAPVAWEAPANAGYTGAFETNDRLAALELLSLGDDVGPEDVATDEAGRLYVSTHAGYIVRLRPDGTGPERWVHTGGRPLGLDFDAAGHLIVADASRGLLRIAPDGRTTVLATAADGVPISLADDVDVAADGKIYFTDASAKFGGTTWGTAEASVLDIVEHGGHGRLLVHDPATGATTTVRDGLQFANGVAVGHDQTYVLVSETGSYRVLRVWIAGARRGAAEPFIESLPGFPDNISAGRDGRYWIALYAPRNLLLDRLSARPFLRKVLLRVPAVIRPRATAYGHIIAVDTAGRVVADLQDPTGRYPMNTSVHETATHLYVGSLVAPGLGRLRK